MSRDEEVVRKIIIQRFEAAYNDLKPYYEKMTGTEKDAVDFIDDIIVNSQKILEVTAK
jgi:hypothetical protein